MRGRDLSSQLALALTAAATTWVALLSWSGFTAQPGRFLGPLLLLGLVLAGLGAVLRSSRVPGWAVVPLQLLAAGASASFLLSGSPVPAGPAGERLVETLSDAWATAGEYAAPVPASVPGVHPLLILGGLVLLLLVDLLACTLRRAPVAGLVLLAIYAIPVGAVGGGVSWWVFVATAAGFLTLLFLQESEQVGRWGRPLGTDAGEVDPAGFGVRTGAIRGSAGGIGAVAIALAVALPLFIPTLQLQVFDFGRGPGGGSNITIVNPMTDLRRDLTRPRDVPLLQVRTDDPDPTYLRISVLNRFSSNEWSSGDRNVPPDQVADGRMPPMVGVASGVNRTNHDYEVRVGTNFASSWLPTQAPVSRVRAPGDWRYDSSTMDFIAYERGLSTAGLSYEMTATKLDIQAADLARATSSSGLVDRLFTELPPGLPTSVRNIANSVTRDAPTRFEKAVALQNWFRRTGGFTYDTDVAAGNGTDELVAFLSDTPTGRTGYCEQFASAYAVLARVLGIPARVAVGFLEPRSVGPRTWEFSAHDLHAWPELFFPGAGWVRFEPTPSGRASSVPQYTTQEVPAFNPTAQPSTAQPSDQLPDRGESGGPSLRPDEAGQGGSGEAGFPWPWVLGVLGAVVGIGLLLLVPRVVRRARRGRRLDAGPEAAWRELAETVTDLGIPWPAGRSPRQTRHHLVEFFGAPADGRRPERPAHGPGLAPDAVLALDRIVDRIERGRYSRAGDDGCSVRADLEACLAALEAGASRAAVRRAHWWPRSVVSRRSRQVRDVDAEVSPTRDGGVVDHVG
ncbi:transglutaminaseTgpA domain-containing protein [Nocardioides sp.]|uniref:transglutaminase family protein n=1 Tax=Nocardioides sp. TaxID=35761 RepID=UPI0035617A47